MDTTSNTSPFVVLAAVDGSPATQNVVTSAARLTQMIAGGELHLLHVVDRVADAELMLPNDSDADLDSNRRGMVEAAARRARELGVARVFLHVIEGRPTQGILQTASDLRADLVLVGTHGRKGLDRLVMGSCAESIVRSATCPVLVVREKTYDENAPRIEPPCPDCVAAQRASKGTTLWCARHAEHHPHAHLHYEFAEPFATGSMFLR